MQKRYWMRTVMMKKMRPSSAIANRFFPTMSQARGERNRFSPKTEQFRSFRNILSKPVRVNQKILKNTWQLLTEVCCTYQISPKHQPLPDSSPCQSVLCPDRSVGRWGTRSSRCRWCHRSPETIVTSIFPVNIQLTWVESLVLQILNHFSIISQ